MRNLFVLNELLVGGIKSLKGHGFRTFLTMLGISFGIFTITGILTMVDSLEFTITKNISALGNSVMFVHNWPWKDNSRDWQRYFNRPKVSYNEFVALKNGLENVEGVSFHIRARNQTLKHEGNSLTGIEALGITHDYGNLYNLNIQEGRYFSPVETETGRPVCILGISVAEKLLGEPPYEGMSVRFLGQELRVIGVLKRQGTAMFGPSIDEMLFMPYTFASRKFNVNARGIEKLITVKAKSYEDMPAVEGNVIGIMRKTRGLKPAVEDDFSINKQEMLMNQVSEIFKYLSWGGVIISIFSILVGGFGIGNIMYASVKERTFEIGLMKAVGASPSFILYQFLVEAIMLCLLGGAVGLSLLAAFTFAGKQIIASSGMDFEIVMSLRNIFYGVGISAGIGLIAGFLPALFASRLDPVETLRSK